MWTEKLNLKNAWRNSEFYTSLGSHDQFDLQNIPCYAHDPLQAISVSGTLCTVIITGFVWTGGGQCRNKDYGEGKWHRESIHRWWIMKLLNRSRCFACALEMSWSYNQLVWRHIQTILMRDSLSVRLGPRISLFQWAREFQLFINNV